MGYGWERGIQEKGTVCGVAMCQARPGKAFRGQGVKGEGEEELGGVNSLLLWRWTGRDRWSSSSLPLCFLGVDFPRLLGAGVFFVALAMSLPPSGLPRATQLPCIYTRPRVTEGPHPSALFAQQACPPANSSPGDPDASQSTILTCQKGGGARGEGRGGAVKAMRLW